MGTRAPEASVPHVPTSRRWLARLALVAASAVVVAVLVGGWGSLVLLGAAALGLALVLAGAWWFLSNLGPRRWLGAATAVVGPVATIAFYVAQGKLLEVALAVLLAVTATTAARLATEESEPMPEGMPETPATPPTRPFLVMNPRSGGGKVGRFGLDALATDLGATVRVLDGPEHVDVAELAQEAAAGGADLLGVAGGDGTQALVAGVAAQHGLPFLVISAGTRNHFALDLGLDRERPDTCLAALGDGVDLWVDLGRINGRTFVNNVSFGAYADIVQSPEYRDDKRGTTLQMLPDILAGHRGPRLDVRIDGETVVEAPQALLVSNNPYGLGDLAGLGRRARLDRGVLGVVAVTVGSAGAAAGLLSGRHSRGVTSLVAHEVVVDADTAEIPVGVDGEAVVLPTPVRCVIVPRALRVRVPRIRPGVPPHRPPTDWRLVRRQALDLGRLASPGGQGRAVR
jgi:diacylglycerol kinase family enzyme